MALLREQFPTLKIRFLNVVDLYKLMPHQRAPARPGGPGLRRLFTVDKPVIFNFHGYPLLIHRLTYGAPITMISTCAAVGRKGSINTPLDLAIQNQIDRFRPGVDVIDRVPALRAGAHAKERLRNMQIACWRTPTNTASISRIEQWK